MYKVNVNQKFNFEIELDKKDNTKATINGNQKTVDIIEVSKGSFSIIKDYKSYNAEVLHFDALEKKMDIRVNGNRYQIDVKDQFDELLQELGMDNLASAKIKDVKAPMPGLVLDILVSPGQTIAKDEPILILEAMKMENVLKSPTDGVIKSIAAIKSAAVEKNQVLISFE
jgi:biotin carboxyl carrier protein